MLRDITRHLRQHLGRLSRSGLRRSQVQTLGTSAGGLAALVVAQQLGLAQGVAIGAGGEPQTFRPGGAVARAHGGIGSWWPRWPRTRLVLAYPEHNAADRSCAGSIASYYQQQHRRQSRISGRVYRGCTHHTLFHDLLLQGVNLEQAMPSLLRTEARQDEASEGLDPLAWDVGAEELAG